jgi:hypothetical protein
MDFGSFIAVAYPVFATVVANNLHNKSQGCSEAWVGGFLLYYYCTLGG